MKKVTKSTGNVFEDLALENAGELQTRARLGHQIYSIIKGRGLKQKEAAQILGLTQPDVSELMNGRFTDFSVDRLLNLLVRLNQDVEIVIRPMPEGKVSEGIHISVL
ncbi:MAG: helix-turn-helix domain-containing protein [Blastocatellales bacterium]